MINDLLFTINLKKVYSLDMDIDRLTICCRDTEDCNRRKMVNPTTIHPCAVTVIYDKDGRFDITYNHRLVGQRCTKCGEVIRYEQMELPFDQDSN